ncbi:MAG TPA: AAA family ATPase, partial [Lachnospiraceae bacterium]|nr:AAA family ATPase [Lachnospiraceae bacterium]
KKQAEKTKRSNQAAKTIANKQSILAYIAENGSAGSADIAEHIGLSQTRVRALLLELGDDEKIKPYGNGRSRRYALPESED